jgi:two-component system, sensor histidine kinase PdtaS
MVGEENTNPTGKAFPDFILPDDRDSFLGRYRPFLKNPDGKDMEVRLGRGVEFFHARLTGRVEPQKTGSEPIVPENVRLLLIVHDITTQKKAEAEIRALLSEKETLLQEVHHRVKNNMTAVMALLSLQSSQLKEQAAVQALLDARQRLETMLLVYDALRPVRGYNEVELTQYLSTLLDRIEKSFNSNDSVQIVKDLEDITVDPGTASQVGIIVNELVTNAFKHAFPSGMRGVLQVRVKKQNESRFLLFVCDDGVGFPEGTDRVSGSSSDSLGLTLIQAITQQLGGAFEVASDSSKRKGVCFSVLVPLRYHSD